MEESLTMGLGCALTEEARFRGGEILHRSFDMLCLTGIGIHRISNRRLNTRRSLTTSGGARPCALADLALAQR